LKNNNDYLPPFINIADESEAKCHPIYITYAYSEENFYMQAKLRDDSDIYEDCNPRMIEPMLEERATVNTFFELYQEINENESYKDIRKPEYIRKAYISDRMSNDKIIITINLNMFVEDDGHFSMYPDDILNFAAVMAHELQHIVEQYIFARHNCLSGIRNRITLDVNKENEFEKIKNQLYFKSACLLINLISPAEIRARLTQLDYYMKTLCKNVPEEFIDEIYSQYILCKYENGSDVVDNLIETVFKNGNIRNITRFQSLRNIINNIKTYKIHQERELNNGSTMLYSLLIVLYYLVNHKFIEREKLADELSYILEY